MGCEPGLQAGVSTGGGRWLLADECCRFRADAQRRREDRRKRRQAVFKARFLARCGNLARLHAPDCFVAEVESVAADQRLLCENALTFCYTTPSNQYGQVS